MKRKGKNQDINNSSSDIPLQFQFFKHFYYSSMLDLYRFARGLLESIHVRQQQVESLKVFLPAAVPRHAAPLSVKSRCFKEVKKKKKTIELKDAVRMMSSRVDLLCLHCTALRVVWLFFLLFSLRLLQKQENKKWKSNDSIALGIKKLRLSRQQHAAAAVVFVVGVVSVLFILMNNPHRQEDQRRSSTWFTVIIRRRRCSRSRMPPPILLEHCTDYLILILCCCCCCCSMRIIYSPISPETSIQCPTA